MTARACPYRPYCGCEPGTADIACPAVDPKACAPLDHEAIRLDEALLFRSREFACLVAVALLGTIAIWLGVQQ